MKEKSQPIEKPKFHINILIKHMLPETTELIVREKKTIYYHKNNNIDCYLLIDGEVLILSLTDRSIIARVKAPFIFGLGAIDHNACLQTLTESTFAVLPTVRAHKIIQESNLWEHMYYFFRRIAVFSHQRTQALKQPKARQIILAVLRNLQSEPAEKIRNTNVLLYIQENTPLSRSRIYSILTELKAEGIITIRNGRLIRSDITDSD